MPNRCGLTATNAPVFHKFVQSLFEAGYAIGVHNILWQGVPYAHDILCNEKKEEKKSPLF